MTWNTRDLTVEALRRLLDGDQQCDLRLLVHDNGSTDGTVAALRERVPEADVEAGAANLGFAAGVNRLLARSDAPWFLVLNSDAWPAHDGCVARLVTAAETRPRAAVVAPRLERPDGALEHSTYPFPSVGVAAFTAVAGWRWLGRERARRMLLEGAWPHDVPRPVDWAVGAAWLLRRAAVDDVGPLDESFFMYVEDLEWCWRAWARGWQVWFDPAARIVHVGDASGRQSYGRARTAAYLQNTYRFYRRTHGAAATAAFRAFNAVGCARLYVDAVVRARGRSERSAFWADHLRVHLRPARADPAHDLRARAAEGTTAAGAVDDQV